MRDQEEAEPSHHARRPMNAFLIFCKRHRSVVRDKYPNLENRSITKILGEWWANLEKDDKACYTGLAKQYKDAFFNANPDFKWYKLPAPPLRTVASRPRESHDKAQPESPDPDFIQEKTNNNSTKIDFNKNFDGDFDADQKPLSMFTPGKLADEAQMGGLSSLLSSKTEAKNANTYYTPTKMKLQKTATSTPIETKFRPNILNHNRSNPRQELKIALSETTQLFEDFGSNNKNQNVHNSLHDNPLTNQDVINQIVDKGFSKDEDTNGQNRWSDDERNTRSGRSCKGKRYQEFMAVGGLINNKKQRRECAEKSPDEGYNASCSWELNETRSDSQSHTDDSKPDIGFNENSNDKSDSETNESKSIEQDNHCNKTFNATDFDLDAKIRALPSLSLEKFQQRKRENKRKKKTLSFKPKSESIRKMSSTPYVPHDNFHSPKTWKEAVIGSQKRKPRKISITRLEINSTITSVNLCESRVGSELKMEGKLVSSDSRDASGLESGGCADLLALATLAEVAANTRKMDAGEALRVHTNTFEHTQT